MYNGNAWHGKTRRHRCFFFSFFPQDKTTFHNARTVHPVAEAGHGRGGWIETRTNVRHVVADPDGGAQERIPQGDNLSGCGHVDGHDDTGIVGRQPDVAVLGSFVRVGDLEQGSAAGQAADHLSDAR